MLGTLMKTCRKNPDLLTVAQKYWALYVSLLPVTKTRKKALFPIIGNDM